MDQNRLRAALRVPRLQYAEPGRAVPVGHRGAPKIFPENTMESIDRAMDLGAWMIEIDIRQTKDGVLAVFHDEDLKRLTGVDGTVQTKTWKELQKLSVEGWFKIPRLEDVLVRLRERLWLNVEVKQADAARVAEVIKSCGMTDQVIISSFDWAFIDAIALAEPALSRALLTEEKQDAAAALAKHQATGFFPRADLVDAALVEQVHAAGGYVMPWTVDEPDAMRKLVALGVDAICSNDVEALVAATA